MVLRIDLGGDRFRDKLLGCWLGKSAGGTLGTPVEKAWGEPEPFDIWWYPEIKEGGLPNDDLEMQLVWLVALEQVGPGLTARDLTRYWLDHIGYNFDEYGLSKTNLRLGLEPPVSGAYNNWFLDCMGCPIRSEIWACIAPGAPRIAARYAYQDAICDHAGGESVYGELFNVALQSAAFVLEDKRTLIDVALSYIPDGCMTARAVHTALAARADGLDWKQARARVLAATPSPIAQYSPINLGFQVIGWLWGTDFGNALCTTVNCGYDTDSSGGSVGSWLGIFAGKSGLPEKWIAPFADAIATNESWGGVRHLTDGTTPVPTNLSELAARITATARHILAAHDVLTDGGTVAVAESDLYADDTVRTLWERNPMQVRHSSPVVDVTVDYGNTPAVAADSTKHLVTILRNPHPDPLRVRATLRVPANWTAPEPHSLEIPAQQETAVEWRIAIPGRSMVENSNRLDLLVETEGRPQQPAVPIVLIGARATRIAGTYPADSADETTLLDRPFPPEQDTDADWRDITVLGNALPIATTLDRPGVAYIQTFLHAPRDMDIMLGIDSSHPTKAWLKGTELFTANRYRPIRPNYSGSKDGYHTVTLTAGWNEILLKIARGHDAGTPECHILTSTADKLHHGLPELGRTHYPWDRER